MTTHDFSFYFSTRLDSKEFSTIIKANKSHITALYSNCRVARIYYMYGGMFKLRNANYTQNES